MVFSDKVGCAIIRMTISSRFLPLNMGCTAFDDKNLHKMDSNIATPIKEIFRVTNAQKYVILLYYC